MAVGVGMAVPKRQCPCTEAERDWPCLLFIPCQYSINPQRLVLGTGSKDNNDADVTGPNVELSAGGWEPTGRLHGQLLDSRPH